METAEELNIRISFNRKNVLSLLVLFFLCWHPGYIESESLTLTTYYPAPYGGYVSLLTTGGNAGAPVNTLLVRDAGTVGIGSGASVPTGKLEVRGGYLNIVNAEGGAGTWRLGAVNGVPGAYSTGLSAIRGDGGLRLAGRARDMSTGADLFINTSGNVGINTTGPTERLHVNGNVRIEAGNLGIGGDGVTTGFITGICQARNFGTGTSSCLTLGSGYRVIATYGTVSCPSSGQLFLGGDIQNPTRWRPYVVEGCGGTMLCCRIRDF